VTYDQLCEFLDDNCACEASRDWLDEYREAHPGHSVAEIFDAIEQPQWRSWLIEQLALGVTKDIVEVAVKAARRFWNPALGDVDNHLLQRPRQERARYVFDAVQLFDDGDWLEAFDMALFALTYDDSVDESLDVINALLRALHPGAELMARMEARHF